VRSGSRAILKHDPPLVEVGALVDDIDASSHRCRCDGRASSDRRHRDDDRGRRPRAREYDAVRVTGLRLDPKVVERQLEKLLKMTVAQRRTLRGMEPERADVIAGGVAIYARLLQQVGATKFITCDRGIRWGLAYEMSTGR
jgi:exopolyphosphatase/guanosine-5'-triphosphate,3'-diphosphate pyrophosphatase